MNCRHIEILLSQQQEAALSERDSRIVAEHLPSCERCRRRQETFQTIGSALRAPSPSEEWEPGSDLVASALLQWNAERKPVRTPFWTMPRRGYALAMAATVVIAGILYAVTMRPQDKPRIPSVVIQDNGSPDNQTNDTPPKQEQAPALQGPIHSGPRLTFSPSKASTLPRQTPTTDDIVDLLPTEQKAVPPAPLPVVDDLTYMNANASKTLQRWSRVREEEALLLQQQIDRIVTTGDDFIKVPFPRVAGEGREVLKAAAASYQREKAVVDPRLSRRATLNAKAASFSVLCKQLSELSGIAFAADKSVADDKATLFCRNRPLRDIMRQVSRVFGFAWRRSDENGAYEYEIYQELRGRFAEEELRNRDRDEALLALDREMEKWRPYRNADPLEMMEKYEKGQVSKEMILNMSASGFAPSQLYFNLTPRQLTDLQSGKELKFGGRPEENGYPLPSIFERVIPKMLMETTSPNGEQFPQDPAAYRDLSATLRLRQEEIGEYRLEGFVYATIHEEKKTSGRGLGAYLAKGMSPGTKGPENAKVNENLAAVPELQAQVSIQPEPSCELKSGKYPGSGLSPGKKVTSADVMEALHQATGMDIVADYYTQLYEPSQLTIKEKRLFDTLNSLGDRLRARWNREEGWLQFRTASFYNERMQEIPDRLLERWAASRRNNGRLTPTDLIEIAQLTDRQLISQHTAAAAMAIYGLQEWPLVSDASRNHLRFLGQLSRASLQAALSEKGVAYMQLPQGLRNQFIALVFDKEADNVRVDLDDLTNANLRVLYRQDDAKVGDHHIDQLLQANNPLLFVYGSPKPGAKQGETSSFLLHRWQCVYGPFNAIQWRPEPK